MPDLIHTGRTMSWMSKAVREPLVHFALAGAVLYGAYVAIGGQITDDDGDRSIVVDRRALLTFMQYRANAFQPDTFDAVLDSVNAAELQEIIDAYVNEEILYREAEALGLEASDYIIRQRMVQKMNFLIGDLADRGAAGSDEALRDYFQVHRESYAVAPWTTFTHVFFDAERHGRHGALEAANALRDELNAAAAGFNDATDRGDRFPFLRNYVERTYEYVASHFGYEFAEQLAGLPASESLWQGPVASALGQHVVMITRQSPRMLPTLEEVRADVERDFSEEISRSAVLEMTESLRSRYTVEVRGLRQAEE
jgi:hypothetical protein